MAMGIDRSKYRNPDMPVGYEKKEPELQYKIGKEIDGVHYITPCIIDEHDIIIDDGTLSDLVLSDDEKEIKDDGTLSDLIISDDEKVIEDDGTLSDLIISDDEKEGPCTSSNMKKTKKGSSVDSENTGKKGYDSCDTSALDASVSCIDRQKHEKRKTKPSPRKSYRSDSNSSSSRHSSSSRNCRPRKKSTYSHSPMDIDHEKYEKKTKTSQRKSYRSDSSSSSSRHSSPLSSYRPRNKSTYSQSPLFNVKRESSVQPQHTSGAYYCRICNMNLNSILSYNAHVNGKRHLKNLRKRNPAKSTAQGIPASASDVPEETSKYPKPIDGVIRKKLQAPAKIQNIIEEMVKRPCIGLNTVTEIQGLKGVQYYCSLCNIVCFSQSVISHLTGQNHMKQSARKFHPNYKEIITDTPKPERDNKILELLNELKTQQGMGKMAVEVEELDSEPANMAYSVSRSIKGKIYSYQPDTSNGLKVQPNSSRDYQNKTNASRGTGSESSDIPFHELCNKASLPNKSGSDFYCQVCQAHMNSQQMWEAHVRGKRHRTNLKKFPGDVPSKTKTVPVPNRRAVLLGRLKIECPRDPIVGLEQIQETEIPKIKTFTYKCFLCGSCVTARDIIEHLLSLKHRMKYLDHISFPGREVVHNMSEHSAYSLVHEMCLQAEAQEGRGEPQVHVLKSLLF